MLESAEKGSASNRSVLMTEVIGRGLVVKEGGVEVWDDRSGFRIDLPGVASLEPDFGRGNGTAWS